MIIMAREKQEENNNAEIWNPRTELGKDVAKGLITSIDQIFKQGRKIKEAEIVDKLIPNLENELILVGGSPGKGGGIRRTPTARTARMHRSGRRYKVSALVVVGNRDGYLGIGKGVALDSKIAIDKATEAAKLNIIPIKRGCGSWECGCGQKHSIPYQVEGKNGSVRVVLIPAPKGIGLCVSDEVKKIMKLAGIQDIWSKSFGKTGTRNNLALAIFNAFKNLNKTKLIEDEKDDEIISEAPVQQENALEEEALEEETIIENEEKIKEKTGIP